MIYLLLNVVFASVFTLLIKWLANRKREDIVTVGAINYIIAALLILPEFLIGGTESTATIAVVTGGVMGTCYFVTYFFVVHAIRQIGASAASVIGGLSILLPIMCAAVIWKQMPSASQWIGIVLAIAALSLVGRHDGGKTVSRSWVTPLIMVLFFLFAGLARLSQEFFKHGTDPGQRPTFLLVTFVFAAVPSLAILVARRFAISFHEFLFGCAMGFANVIQLHFTMKALQELPGFIVFPVASAGSVVLTALVATRLLDEQLSRRTHAGIALASIALVLLNWLPNA